jgi:hypothetical protein
MFISAQKTVTDLIEDKIKNETNLPDYLALLANFKDKNTISGINELYKIIDVSQIENTYRDFKIGEAYRCQLDVRKISYVLHRKYKTSTVVEELPTLIILVIFLRSLFQS